MKALKVFQKASVRACSQSEGTKIHREPCFSVDVSQNCLLSEHILRTILWNVELFLATKRLYFKFRA